MDVKEVAYQTAMSMSLFAEGGRDLNNIDNRSIWYYMNKTLTQCLNELGINKNEFEDIPTLIRYLINH